METRDQVKRGPGGNNNPTGKGGFQERPQDRNPGTWKPENTITFQYRRFLSMTTDEVDAWKKQPKGAKTMAQILAFKRVIAAADSFQDMKEITDRIEGKALQNIDHTSGGEKLPAPIFGGNSATSD